MGRWRQPVCITHQSVPDYTVANLEDSSLWGILNCHPKCFLLYSFYEMFKMCLPLIQAFRAVTQFYGKDLVLKQIKNIRIYQYFILV
jgi:hypothetical protein